MKTKRITNGNYEVKINNMTFCIIRYDKKAWQIYSDNQTHCEIVNGENEYCYTFVTYREAKSFLFNVVTRN